MSRPRTWVSGLIVGAILAAAIPLAGQVNPQIQIAISNLTTGITPFTQGRIVTSGYLNWGSTSGTSGYGLRDNAGVIQYKNSVGDWNSLPSSGSLGLDATYITQIPDTNLTHEQALSALGSALLVNTTTTGVLSAYAGSTCTNQFVRALSALGVATCAGVVITTDTTGTLTVARGGTGITAGTSGGVLAFTATGTLASSALLGDNVLMVGGGAGVAPNAIAAGLGTTTTLMHGNAAGEPTWAAVSLTADVSGITPTANGGTGIAYFTAAGPSVARVYTFPDAATTILTTNAAVTAVQGGTGIASYAIGDILGANTTTTISKIADIATGNALLSGGVNTLPLWGKIGLTTHVSGTLPTANGGTGLTGFTTGDVIAALNGTTLTGITAPAVGQVLISQGVTTVPVWSASPQLASIKLNTTTTFSGTAPTITSGFGTGPSVFGTGTAAAFRVNVGTGGIATAGVIGMPAAGTAWVCSVLNLTAAAGNRADNRTVQTGSTATTITVQGQAISTGAAAAWVASDTLAISCAAY